LLHTPAHMQSTTGPLTKKKSISYVQSNRH
jgi:hypothetical protein